MVFVCAFKIQFENKQAAYMQNKGLQDARI